MTRLPIYSLDTDLPFRPIAWARTADVDGRRITPARYRTWKERAVQRLAHAAGYRQFPGEVSVVVELFPTRTVVRVAGLDADDPRRAGSGLRGDVDNYAKAVLDALQSAKVISDDRMVADLEVRFRR